MWKHDLEIDETLARTGYKANWSIGKSNLALFDPFGVFCQELGKAYNQSGTKSSWVCSRKLSVPETIPGR